MLKPHVQEFINFATQSAGLNVNIEQVQVSTRSSFADRTLADVHIQRDLDVIVLAVRKAAGEMLFNPPPDIKIAAGDHLIVMGAATGLQKLEHLLTGAHRVKVLTAQQMREADRQTIAGGTPADVLMSRAGTKVVEFIESEFAPLGRQRVVIFCGSGNNGGDGVVVGRLLKTRVASLQLVKVTDTPGPVDRDATIVIDALLGTGFHEPLEGRYAELIATINSQFPRAKVVAVDIPSAMQVRADFAGDLRRSQGRDAARSTRRERRETDCSRHRHPCGILAVGSGTVRAARLRAAVSAPETGREQRRLRPCAGSRRRARENGISGNVGPRRAAHRRGSRDCCLRGFFPSSAGIDDAVARCHQPGSHDSAGDRTRLGDQPRAGVEADWRCESSPP